ncbi:hypothetical protein Tco_0296010 [Tanacetum coccineum]
MNDIVSSDEEWEESDYGNLPNITTDSFFKPYLNAQEKDDIKEDERSQKKRKGNNNIINKAPKSNNQNNEQPSKRVCKAKKFEAIKYSLGPNEEYIVIRSYEYNAWERNKDSVSHIYQDIFSEKGQGMDRDAHHGVKKAEEKTSIRRILSIPYGVLNVWTLSVLYFSAFKTLLSDLSIQRIHAHDTAYLAD